MGIVVKVGDALQRLFGEIAETAARESGVIQRTRKFTAISLARTFVLGFLQSPTASDEKLAQMAVQCGAAVTPQAIEQRHTPRLVDFLERLFRGATKLIVGSDQALAPILERFPAVTVLDSSTISLPDEPTGDAAWQGRVADRRLGLLRVGRVRNDGCGGRVLSVAFAVWHPRVAAFRYDGGSVALAGEAAWPVRRCLDPAGARATLAVSFDGVAFASRTSESPPPEAA
jgi:hypothetical protein